MKKFAFNTLVVILAIIPGIAMAVPSVTTDSASSVSQTPSVSASDSSVASAPSTTGSVSSVGTAPSTNASSVSSAGSAPISTGGNSSSGSQSNSGSSSYGSSAPMVTAISYSTNSCPFITSYMNFGGNNNPEQVTRLQNFLKNIEKLDLDINGTYDEKTRQAVSVFQTKYAKDILVIWGATQPSGNVYLMTSKKINQIVCAMPIAISNTEIETVKAYRNKLHPVIQVQTVVSPDVQLGPKKNTSIDQDQSSTTSSDDEVGSTQNANTENTAGVANTSVMGRFWNFLKRMF